MVVVTDAWSTAWMPWRVDARKNIRPERLAETMSANRTADLQTFHPCAVHDFIDFVEQTVPVLNSSTPFGKIKVLLRQPRCSRSWRSSNRLTSVGIST